MEIVEYYPLTGETIRYPAMKGTDAIAAGLRMLDHGPTIAPRPHDSGQGSTSSDVEAETTAPNPLSNEGLQYVSDTTAYPWITIVKVYAWYPFVQKPYECSGAILGPFHVLTAAHCVHAGGNGPNGWFDDLYFLPGMNNGWNVDDYRDAPLGMSEMSFAAATVVRVYSNWTHGADPEDMRNHDFALVTLDRPIGDRTGWMGWATGETYFPRYFEALTHAGYPSDNKTYFGQHMFSDTGKGCATSEHSHWFNITGVTGQSGGPVWTTLLAGPEEPYILSILTYPESNHPYGCKVRGTRLNHGNFDRIDEWMVEDFRPVALPELTEHVAKTGTRLNPDQPHSKFSPAQIRPNETLNITIQVRNIGLADSSQFFVDFFASENEVISFADWPLGWKLVPPLGPMEVETVQLSISVPTSIPDGRYNVGWIIDSFDEVMEYDEQPVIYAYPDLSLNKGYVNYQDLLIDSEPPYITIDGPTFAASSGYTINWKTWDDGAGLVGTFQLQESQSGRTPWVTVCENTISGPSARGSCPIGARPESQRCYRGIASDGVGNQHVSTILACLFVDGSPPSINLRTPPIGTTAGHTVDWSAKDRLSGLVGTFQLQEAARGSSEWAAVCTQTVSGSEASGTCNIGSRAHMSEWCYRGIARDAVGNEAVSSQRYAVDMGNQIGGTDACTLVVAKEP